MSAKTPLISIIIPVFNDAEYLPDALESCLGQTYNNIEIVVVDDASTDGTPDVISRYAKKHATIKTITHDKNKKTLQAIKTGVLAAKGNYIMVVSGDDTFEPNAAETCVNVVHKNPSVDVVHFGRRVLKKGRQVRTLVPEAMKLKGNDILKHIFSLTKGSQGSISNKCWKKDLLVKVFTQVEPKKQLVLGEDQVVVFLAALQAKTYVSITDVLHNYNFGMGMDGRSDIDLRSFIDYRLGMADSMDELEAQLRSLEVEEWVWEYATALKREHYGWSALYAQHLEEPDRFKALKAWTDRTNAKDTLIGVATTVPEQFLDEYLGFLSRYQPSGFNTEDVVDILSSIVHHTSRVSTDRDEKISWLRSKNNQLNEKLHELTTSNHSASSVVERIKRKLSGVFSR